MNSLTTKNIIPKNTDIGSFTELDALIDRTIINCFNILMQNYELVKHNPAPESIHQLRISIRRFKSIVNFFKEEIEPKGFKKITKILKRLIKPTAQVRDFDTFIEVYIERAISNNSNDDDFKSLKNISDQKKNDMYNKLATEIESDHYLFLLNELKTCVNNYTWRGKSTQKRKQNLENRPDLLIRKRIKKVHSKLEKKLNDIPKLSIKELHTYRTKIKELRYVIEELGSFIDHDHIDVKDLKELQSILGAINDSYIANNIIGMMDDKLKRKEVKKYLKNQIKYSRSINMMRLKKMA